MTVLNKIEDTKTGSSDKPQKDVVITDCGLLSGIEE